MGKIYKGMMDLIGGTPLMELNNMGKKRELKGRILAKIEYFNPTESVKDRAAMGMIMEAEERGLLTKGAVIIEPTSGNTGIGLAAIGAVRGYSVILTMPETMSVERRNILKAYGANVVLTKGDEGMAGAIKKAEELAAKTPKSFVPNQFDNMANVRIHYETTGPEIWEDTKGEVDVLVCGVGTGGTITGTGKFLKTKKSEVKVIAVEPTDSPMLSEGQKGPHQIQGIGAGFVPGILDRNIYDEIITVESEDAFDTAKELAKTEGILAGISSGAALWATLKVAERLENEGKNIVVILPDTGGRYYSTPLFHDKI
jgi:cysteine synthase A